MHASAQGAPLTECVPLTVLTMDGRGITLDHDRLGRLPLPLLGRFQAANAAVALGIIEALALADVAEVSDDAIRDGLARTRWPGRLELLDLPGTTVLLDGAHNPDGMAGLAATVDELTPSLPPGRATLLLGVMRDKEVEDMLTSLARSRVLHEARCFATVVPDTERALPADELAAQWLAVTGKEAGPVPDVEVALERALASAEAEDGPLVAAGSLYLVGHLRATLVPGVEDDSRA